LPGKDLGGMEIAIIKTNNLILARITYQLLKGTGIKVVSTTLESLIIKIKIKGETS
jgi:hypothetical protein